MKQFCVYITTNPGRTALYIGVTSNLRRRIVQHFENRGTDKSHTGKYHCYNLIYYDEWPNATQAIAREKQLKKWSRKKKEALIRTRNPDWVFLDIWDGG